MKQQGTLSCTLHSCVCDKSKGETISGLTSYELERTETKKAYVKKITQINNKKYISVQFFSQQVEHLMRRTNPAEYRHYAANAIC